MSRMTLCACALCVFLAVAVAPALVSADVCLMAYTTSPCYYHYSETDFYTVGPGDPLYDPLYDRGGEVLISVGDGKIAFDVYQATNLLGFVHDEVNQGYFAVGLAYDLVIDGYNQSPITYHNILVVFDTIDPAGCVPMITVDGNPGLFDAALGYYYPIGDLDVSTPTPVGNSYSDTIVLSVQFDGCYGFRAWGFADENHNLMHDLPGECFTAYSHDVSVPVGETTWGGVKQLYR